MRDRTGGPVPRHLLALLAGGLALAALTGCTSNPVAAHPTRSPTAAPSTPAPSASPTTPPPTQDAAAATPVDVDCDVLVPAKIARRLVPELQPEPGFEPKPGSPVARLGALDGTVCGWADDQGDRLQVAVAKPSARDATALKNDLVDRSNSVPTYRGEAYFQVVDHVGQVDAFRGRTWILVRSNRFFEPGDAIDVVAAADRALGFAPKPSPSPDPTLTIAPAPTATTNG